MATARYGGETPLIKYGTELTAESPAATSPTVPIEQGDIFKFGGTAADGTAFKLAACAAGNDFTSEGVLLMALHRCEKANYPVGVKLLSRDLHQIRRLRYDGTAPTLGQSIEIAAGNVRKVTGKSQDGDGRVMAVNTATTEVEVLC